MEIFGKKSQNLNITQLPWLKQWVVKGRKIEK